MPPEGPDHATTRLRTTRQFTRRESSRWHVRMEAPLRLGDSEPVPDLSIVEGDIDDYSNAHPTSALLVVEIADTSVQHDQTAKALLYAQARIPEYWIVNLEARRLEVYRDPTPQGYQTTRFYSVDETVRPLFEPEWEIKVGELIR
ncbi:MAG: Uma2 family endonuclease, partial [Fimbriimonadales bacterium]|nr:Uma2 family endonuclease [Fimbriimonadales bacterium]